MRIKSDASVIVLLFVLVCACAFSRAAGKLEKWTENMKAFAKFRCREPQLRAVRAEELLGEKMKRFEVAFPHQGVLRRCADDTGCCNDLESTCATKTSEDVTLYFRIYDKVRGTHRFETYEGKMDTECACRKMENSIK